MAIQIGAKPDSGFDDPIGMLKDCHRRIEHFLGIFSSVAENAQGRTLMPEERAALEAALRYFRESGPRHNADEEQSLFSRLRAECTTDSLEQIEKLESQHRLAAHLHEAVDHLFSAWASGGKLKPKDDCLLRSDTKMLRLLYTEHIYIEETVVFPLAAQLLDHEARARIGAEFQMRRK